MGLEVMFCCIGGEFHANGNTWPCNLRLKTVENGGSPLSPFTFTLFVWSVHVLFSSFLLHTMIKFMSFSY